LMVFYSDFFQHSDHALCSRRIKGRLRFFARQEYFKQFVVGQFKQIGQYRNVLVRQVKFITVKKALNHEIVFQQAPSGTPTKTRTPCGIRLM